MTLSFLSSPDFPTLKQEVLDLNFQTFLKLHNVSQQDRDDWAGTEQDKAISSHPISFPSQTFLWNIPFVVSKKKDGWKKPLVHKISPTDGLLPDAKSLHHHIHSESFLNETQLYSPRTWYPILPFPFNSPSPPLHEPQLSQVILVQRIISSEGRQQTIQAKTNDWTLKVTAKSMQTTDPHFCFLSEHQQFVQMSVS